MEKALKGVYVAFGCALLVPLWTGCFSAVTMTDFQTGETPANDSVQIRYGVALAQWWKADTDSSTGVWAATFNDQTVAPVLFAQVQGPVMENIQAGGELATTLGSFNLKLFGKLGIPAHPFGASIAILPSLGGGFGAGPDTLFGVVKVAKGLNSDHLIASIAVPTTFRFTPTSSLTITPFLYTERAHVSYEGLDGDVELKNDTYGISSQGLSVMVEVSRIRVQATVVNVKKGYFVGLVGLAWPFGGN